MIEITFQAVSKIIVAVFVGAFSCGAIPNHKTTMRDFSFLISNVLLPSLTVTNTASSVDLHMLVRCSVLLFFGVLVVFVGIGGALIMARFLFTVKKTSTGIPAELCDDVRLDLYFDADPAGGREKPKGKGKGQGTPYVAVMLSKKMREMGIDGHGVVAGIEVPTVDVEEAPFYYWGSWVACSIQNAVTLPLSLLQNLCESVPWLSFSEGTAYIFVFSITASLYIWACGPFYVERAQRETTRRRLIREIVTGHKKMMSRCDAITQTEVSYTASYDVLRGGVPRNDAVPLFPVAATRGDERASPVGRCPNAPSGGDDDGAPRETSVTVGGSPRPLPPVSSGVEVGEQTELEAWSPNTASRFSFADIGGAEQVPYNWETAGFLRVKYADQLRDAEGPSAFSNAMNSAKHLGMRLVTSIPFMSIVVGVFIGIVPPIRNLFFGGPLEMLMDAVTLVGQGNIPAALLLLGANLVGSTATAMSGPAEVRMRDFEQNTYSPSTLGDGAECSSAAQREDDQAQEQFDEHASFSLQSVLQQRAAERVAAARAAEAAAAGDKGGDASPHPGAAVMREGDSGGDAKEKGGGVASAYRALSLDGVKKRFVWGVIIQRLFITPALGFLLLIFTIQAAPFVFGGKGSMDKTLLVVLFIELSAPTAINSALLFNQRDYMTYPWAKMVFFQYVLCTFTMVMWATVGLEYVSRYVE